MLFNMLDDMIFYGIIILDPELEEYVSILMVYFDSV